MDLLRKRTSSSRQHGFHSSSLCLLTVATLLGGCGSLRPGSKAAHRGLDVEQVRAAVPIGTAAEDVDDLLLSRGIKQPVHRQSTFYARVMKEGGIHSQEPIEGDFLVVSDRTRSGLLVEWVEMVEMVALQLDAEGRVADYRTGGFGYGP